MKYLDAEIAVLREKQLIAEQDLFNATEKARKHYKAKDDRRKEEMARLQAVERAAKRLRDMYHGRFPAYYKPERDAWNQLLDLIGDGPEWDL